MRGEIGMSNNKNSELEQCTEKLEAITDAVKGAAQACQGDVTALLALLRQLEKLHKEIRDGIFQDSLPDNRQRLYSLLKDIESEGGWPYIERMRLQAFLVKMDEENAVVKDTKDAIDKDKSSEW